MQPFHPLAFGAPLGSADLDASIEAALQAAASSPHATASAGTPSPYACYGASDAMLVDGAGYGDSPEAAYAASASTSSGLGGGNGMNPSHHAAASPYHRPFPSHQPPDQHPHPHAHQHAQHGPPPPQPQPPPPPSHSHSHAHAHAHHHARQGSLPQSPQAQAQGYYDDGAAAAAEMVRRASVAQDQRMESEMLHQSGLHAFGGDAGSPRGSVSGFAVPSTYAAPARSLSYTAGETVFGGPAGEYASGLGGYGGSGSGAGSSGAMRPPMPRAETTAGIVNANVSSQNLADPFARLRAGHISITPSGGPSAPSSSPQAGLQQSLKSRLAGSTAYPARTNSLPAGFPPTPTQPQAPLAPSTPYPQYSVSNPVYDLYGSSYSSVAAPAAASPSSAIPPTSPKAASTLTAHRASFSTNPTGPSDAYDPQALGLPMPPPRVNDGASTSNSYQNIYSSSGFDLVGTLARVVNRKKPTIEIGAIDMSCSFVVVDARRFDQPIVYASETFSKLTGYTNEEIVGRNCRFLQAPGDQSVVQGEKRRYTDGNAAHHLREHIVKGEETQVSLINYHKGGEPFINLVTVVPISWDADSDQVDFFVGFQINLVSQPAAILDKMQSGAYIVNYSLAARSVPRQPMSVTSGDLTATLEHLEESAHQAADNAVVKAGVATAAVQHVRDQLRVDEPGEVVDLVAKAGLDALANDTLKMQFRRLLIDECDDLVHVVSLKGALLYISGASRRMLEYEPFELLGKPLASFCHPSDIVTVQRELKDAGVAAHPSVNLVYRIRRKHSGYMWFEAQGRLHLEPGKGRKCVILSGRPREVFKMSWRALEDGGGISAAVNEEFFAKICVDGIFLMATESAGKVLGVKNVEADVMGKSLGDLSPPDSDDAERATAALLEASKGNASRVTHRLRNGAGEYVDVVTRFFPVRSEDQDHRSAADEAAQSTAPTQTATGGRSVAVVAQICTRGAFEEKEKRAAAAAASPLASSADATAAPSVISSRGASSSVSATVDSSVHSHSAITAATTACASSAGVAIQAPVVAAVVPGTGPPGLTSFSAVPSTFKSLTTRSTNSDNVFDELDVTRGTAWTYELHQLKLTNKKLREEREALEAMRKKKKAAAKAPPQPVKNGPAQRACANCGRTSSAEWRSGPTGPKTLCNACGLRWSKARSQAAAAERKRKDEEEVAARVKAQQAAAAAAAGPPSPARSSSEAQSRSNSRDSGSGGDSGMSTDLTTVSGSPNPFFHSPAYPGSTNASPTPFYSPFGAPPLPPHVQPQPAYGFAQPKPARPQLQHAPSSLSSFSYGPDGYDSDNDSDDEGEGLTSKQKAAIFGGGAVILLAAIAVVVWSSMSGTPATSAGTSSGGAGIGSATATGGDTGSSKSSTSKSASTAASSSKTSAPAESSSSSGGSATSSASGAENTGPMTLKTTYQGESFFDGWTFFDGTDPTNGQVDYLSKEDCQSAGLISASSSSAIMKVDNTTQLDAGAQRKSVRISTTDTVDIGSVVIADFTHMPAGCATWPAWWSFGGTWPEGGEIDILEGVNVQDYNQYTLHVKDSECKQSTSVEVTGEAVEANNDCNANANGNSGCSYKDPGDASYGDAFNQAGGGVFALLFSSDAISIWFWSRPDVPADIDSPDTAAWGTPVASWPKDSCDIETYFVAQNFIFDTTLCGDWAGADGVWSASDSCSAAASTCSDYIADPSHFNEAWWEVSYVKVYSIAGS
ncbi:hypothetical protein JCM10207_001154 [Rhodosporidiobolus poonsookiae]